jgi:hypothetical protein
MSARLTRIQAAAMLALFALVVQFVASFGHVHGQALAARAAGAVISATTAQDDDGGAADLCDVCVTIAQLNTSQAAEPPVPPVRVAHSFAAPAAASALLVPRAPPAAFLPRGPPSAI